MRPTPGTSMPRTARGRNWSSTSKYRASTSSSRARVPVGRNASPATNVRSSTGLPFGGSFCTLGPLKSWATSARPKCVFGRYEAPAVMPKSPAVYGLDEYEPLDRHAEREPRRGLIAEAPGQPRVVDAVEREARALRAAGRADVVDAKPRREPPERWGSRGRRRDRRRRGACRGSERRSTAARGRACCRGSRG